MTTEPQDICTRARQAALARQEADRAKRDTFVREIVGDGFTREEDDTYTICGHRWRVDSHPQERYLELVSNWKGLSFKVPGPVWSLESLGKALLSLDKQVEDNEARYPDTWWGRRKLVSALSDQNDWSY